MNDAMPTLLDSIRVQSFMEEIHAGFYIHVGRFDPHRILHELTHAEEQRSQTTG